MSNPRTYPSVTDSTEVTSMIVWPTIGATRLGRAVGQAAGVKLGIGPVLTLGKLLALASIPAALMAYLGQLVPPFARRYRLTSRRVIVEKGLQWKDTTAIGLDEFDRIEITVLPGQEYLHCGELSFRSGDQEVFHLAGVSRAEVFRQVCLKARNTFVSVGAALREQSSCAEKQPA